MSMKSKAPEVQDKAEFVLCSLSGTSNGQRSYVDLWMESTDGSVFQTGASQHFYAGSNVWVPRASCTLPVTSGFSCGKKFHITWGNPEMTTRRTTIEGMKLGKPEALPMGATFSKSKHGFLVVYVNGAAGESVYEATLTSKGEPNAIVAQASQCYETSSRSNTHVPIANFCVPIFANITYALSGYQYRGGDPQIDVVFVPIESSRTLALATKTIAERVSNTAEEDGFLLAYLAVDNEGDRGYAEVLIQELGASTFVPAAAVAVHRYKSTVVGSNSLLVPISKGWKYIGRLNNTNGKCRLKLTWFPLVGLNAK